MKETLMIREIMERMLEQSIRTGAELKDLIREIDEREEASRKEKGNEHILRSARNIQKRLISLQDCVCDFSFEIDEIHDDLTLAEHQFRLLIEQDEPFDGWDLVRIDEQATRVFGRLKQLQERSIS